MGCRSTLPLIVQLEVVVGVVVVGEMVLLLLLLGVVLSSVVMGVGH